MRLDPPTQEPTRMRLGSFQLEAIPEAAYGGKSASEEAAQTQVPSPCTGMKPKTDKSRDREHVRKISQNSEWINGLATHKKRNKKSPACLKFGGEVEQRRRLKTDKGFPGPGQQKAQPLRTEGLQLNAACSRVPREPRPQLSTLNLFSSLLSPPSLLLSLRPLSFICPLPFNILITFRFCRRKQGLLSRLAGDQIRHTRKNIATCGPKAVSGGGQSQKAEGQ